MDTPRTAEHFAVSITIIVHTTSAIKPHDQYLKMCHCQAHDHHYYLHHQRHYDQSLPPHYNYHHPHLTNASPIHPDSQPLHITPIPTTISKILLPFQRSQNTTTSPTSPFHPATPFPCLFPPPSRAPPRHVSSTAPLLPAAAPASITTHHHPVSPGRVATGGHEAF